MLAGQLSPRRTFVMKSQRAAVIARITREIEDAITQSYPGKGIIGPRMFIELP
jgi:hypothetical protein